MAKRYKVDKKTGKVREVAFPLVWKVIIFIAVVVPLCFVLLYPLLKELLANK